MTIDTEPIDFDWNSDQDAATNVVVETIDDGMGDDEEDGEDSGINAYRIATDAIDEEWANNDDITRMENQRDNNDLFEDALGNSNLNQDHTIDDDNVVDIAMNIDRITTHKDRASNLSESNANQDEDEDEWGNYVEPHQSITNGNGVENKAEDWGDFSEAPNDILTNQEWNGFDMEKQNACAQHEDDGEWGDFALAHENEIKQESSNDAEEWGEFDAATEKENPLDNGPWEDVLNVWRTQNSSSFHDRVEKFLAKALPNLDPWRVQVPDAASLAPKCSNTVTEWLEMCKSKQFENYDIPQLFNDDGTIVPLDQTGGDVPWLETYVARKLFDMIGLEPPPTSPTHFKARAYRIRSSIDVSMKCLSPKQSANANSIEDPLWFMNSTPSRLSRTLSNRQTTLGEESVALKAFESDEKEQVPESLTFGIETAMIEAEALDGSINDSSNTQRKSVSQVISLLPRLSYMLATTLYKSTDHHQ